MKDMIKVITVMGRQHVLKEASDRGSSGHPNSNYMGAGMALFGVLKKNETLKEWSERTGRTIPSETVS